ncbi:hypothetical protein ACFL3V_05665 [Nanoarchaeota archaeon]
MIWPTIAIIVAIIVLGLLIATVYFYRGKKLPPTDYYTFFIMGLIWLPVGIIGLATDSSGLEFFFIMGLAFLGIGLANKDKWKNNHRTWHQLSKQEQKLKTIMIIGLGILALLGVVALMTTRYLT